MKSHGGLRLEMTSEVIPRLYNAITSHLETRTAMRFHLKSKKKDKEGVVFVFFVLAGHWEHVDISNFEKQKISFWLIYPFRRFPVLPRDWSVAFQSLWNALGGQR